MEIIDLIDEELSRIVEALKLKDEAVLFGMQLAPIKKAYDIFGVLYPLVIFSELEPDGTLNVIVEITKRQFLGVTKLFSKGFKLKNGVVTDLTEQELWEFD